MILGKDKHDTAMSWKRQGMVSSFLALEKTTELICCQLSCFGKDKRYMHAMSWKRQAFVEVLEKTILLAQLFHLDNFVVKKRAALFGSVGKFQVRTLQRCYPTKEVE